MNHNLMAHLRGFENVYPYKLGDKFARIVERIAELWDNAQIDGYFSNFDSTASAQAGKDQELINKLREGIKVEQVLLRNHRGTQRNVSCRHNSCSQILF